MTEALYKGASLVSVRKALRDKHLEAAFLSELTVEERGHYARVMATDWVPVAFADRVYSVAAPLLHAGMGVPAAVRLLGRDIARDHLNGVYRFVLRFATVSFVVASTARLWRMYNSKGRLVVVSSEARSLNFALEEYPDYPPSVVESLAGYIVGVIEHTGASNVRVMQVGNDPNRREFRATWR